MARKGYKTLEEQNEANKRYLEKNPEAKKKSMIASIRGAGKRFIREYATLEELEEYEALIQKRKDQLK